MSERSGAWFLFVVMLLVLPFPLLGLGGSVVPVARFAQLAVALSALGLAEGTEGIIGMLIGLLWGHVFLFAALTWLVLAVAKRVARRLVASDRVGSVLAAAAVVVALYLSLIHI